MEITRRTVLTGAAVFGAAAAIGAPGPALAATSPAIQGESSANPKTVERWGVHEIVLRGPDKGNPYVDVTLTAVYQGAGQTFTVPGFYDGDGTFRVRFSPPQTGEWTWAVDSNL